MVIKTENLIITEVSILPIKPRDGLIAFASCIINNFLYIGSIAIHSSPINPEIYRLVYPMKVLPNGKKINCVHPVSKEAGEAITKAVIRKYKEILSKAKCEEF